MIRALLDRLRAPTAEELLQRHLQQARIERAEHARAREYHAAIEAMLKARIERIAKELANG